MKTETAVQEVINIIKADLFFAKTKKEIKYLNSLLEKAKRKEEKQKQQIIDAYDRGFVDGEKDERQEILPEYTTGEQYYNSTFKQD